MDDDVFELPPPGPPAAAPKTRSGQKNLSDLIAGSGDTFEAPPPLPPTPGTTALSPIVGFNRALVDLAGGPVDLANLALSKALYPVVGFNRALVGLAGAPVDIVNLALSKLGVPVSQEPFGGSASIRRALDAIGADPYAERLEKLDIPVSQEPFGGSASIRRGLAAIGADPYAEIFDPRSTTEKVLQAGGGGVGTALGLAAATPAILPRIAVYAPRAAEFLEAATSMRAPTGTSRAAVMAPAAELGTMGFTGGVGSELAGMAVPEKWKGLAEVGGGLAGGGLGALGVAASQAVPVMARGIGDYLAPRTQAGVEALAPKRFAELFASPQAALDVLKNEPAPGMPSVPKTTFETVGEAGGPQLGAAQRAAETLAPEAFEKIRGQQNTAMIDALREIQPEIAPEKLSDRLSAQFKSLDDSFTAANDAAIAAARAKADALGGSLTPDQYGEALRTALQDEKDKMRIARSKLFDAVDPDGVLSIGVKPVLNMAESLKGEIGPYTEPLSADAKRLLDQADGMPPYLAYKDLRDYDAAISSAMSAERRQSGESPNWRRLQQLKSAVYDAIGRGVESENNAQQAAVAEGKLDPRDTIGARINKAASEAGQTPLADINPAGSADANPTFITNLDRSKVYYPGAPKPIEVKYEVVDAPSLVTSNRNDLSLNPDYLQELQPRDRGTIQSQMQIEGISKKPIPERLGPSADINSGAPIVGPDNMVESGNGRTIGMRMAYERGNASEYRDWLESKGFDTTGMENPILIGRRLTELTPEERIKMVQAANTPTSLEMNAVERAAVDAKRIGDIIDKLKSPDLTADSNKDFVRAFADQTNPNEFGTFFDKEGNLSPAGQKRLESAIMSYTFENPALMQRVYNDTDNNIKSLSNALTNASGAWGKMRKAAAEGTIDKSFDITPDLVKNIDLVMRARDEGRPYGFYLRQGDIFNAPSSEATRRMLSSDAQNLNSTKKITSFLNDYANEALSTAQGPTMFGAQPTAEEIVQNTIKRISAQPKEEAPAAAPKAAEPKPEKAAKEEPALRPVPPETMGMDEGARDRLAAAKAAHADYVTTYRQGPVSDVLKTFGFDKQYKMLDSNVVDNVFGKGPAGFDKAQAFLKASAGNPEALNSAKDYIAYTFRRDVLKDGVPDPARFESWKRQYRDALRAFPDELAKYSNAAESGKYVNDLAAQSRDRLNEFKSNAIGRIMGISDPSDISKTVGGLFNRADSIKQIDALAKATANDPAARDGLRSAIAKYINDRFIGLSKTANAEEGALKANQFRQFVKDNRNSLSLVFKPEEVNNFATIANELGTLNQAITTTTGKGGNVRDLFAALQKSRDATTLGPSERTAVSNLTKVGAAAAAGFEAGGVNGAKLGILGALGSIAFQGARQAGLRDIDQMMIEALANPELAKALLEKAPIKSNTGSQITLADKFRKLPTYTAIQMGIPQPDQDYSNYRTARASGGRTGMNVEAAANELVRLAEMTKKQLGQETEPLLDQDDNTIARALEVANQAI